MLLCTCLPAMAQEHVLSARDHFLRMGPRAEWSEWSAHPHTRLLELVFSAEPGANEQTLSIEQQDVKHRWRVILNGEALGTLYQDENAMLVHWSVPPGALVTGRNVLRIEPVDTLLDDVRIGRVTLRNAPLARMLAESVLEVQVIDEETGEPLPSRITITDDRGVLQTIAAEPGPDLAARPGFVYTGSGRARFTVPAGSYAVYATRGFEYGVDSSRVVLEPGTRMARTLRIRREVPTSGWVASDTHVHTVTHSGHGDASIEERALTIAGEGIELPILTDHNVHVDLEPVAVDVGVRRYFTPVTGNEVTTPIGHFNIFPVSPEAPVPDPRPASWVAAFEAISSTPGVGAIILNHARDVHSGFRPFGPERHIASAGMNLDGWQLRANAMEVVNSGAQQSDMMRLFADWFGMLNRGHALTPVGSSDSHDVGRYLVGQARTYIRVPDEDPGAIDISRAVERFRAGAVMVSFGLLAEITVNGRYGPGDLAPAGESVEVAVRVLGPAWTRADRISLYANGQRIRTETIGEGSAAGVKWSGTWRLPRPAHDVFLVAIAEGPGEHRPFWPIAKPYQPTSPDWQPRVVGASGAVWVDGDGDGQPTAARTYAARLMEQAGGNVQALIAALAGYDEAVAIQVAALLLEHGVEPDHEDVSTALAGAEESIRRGFATFAREWHASRSLRAGTGN